MNGERGEGDRERKLEKLAKREGEKTNAEGEGIKR